MERLMPHQVLTEAFKLVSTDRAAVHGEPKENHENIARLWDAYLHDIDHVTAHDVANMMELLKVARRKSGTINIDDYIDGAGYAAIAYECVKK